MKRPDAIPPLARRPETRRYVAALAAVNLAIIAVLAGILYLHQHAGRDRSLRMFEYHQGIASQSQLAVKELVLLQRDMAVAGGPDATTGGRLNTLRLSNLTIQSLQARYADARFDEPTARAVQAFEILYDSLPTDDPGTIAEPGAVSEALDRLAVRLDRLARLHVAASYDMVNDPRGPRILDTRVLLLLFVALIGAGGILNTVIVRRFDTATTERGNAMAALRQSDATLRDERNLTSAILDTANALVVVLDRDGRVVRFNRACELLSGYAAADILGTFVWDRLLCEDEIEPVKQIFRRLTEHKVPGEFESPWLTKDGESRVISWNNSVITDQSGDVEFMVSVGIDVTERRAISDRLVHTAEGLKKAQRIACLGSWEWDINSGALGWSDEIYRMLGAEPGSIEVSFDTFRKIVHPDDWPSVEQAINRSLEEGSPYFVEHRMVRPDGSERVIHETGEVEFDSDNKPCLMRGTAQDITAQRKTEQALRDSEELFRGAFDQAAVGILLTEADGRFIRANPKMCEILGYAEDELMGLTYPDVIHPDDIEATAGIHVLLSKGEARGLPVEKRYLRKDGTVIWARTTISYMRDADGKHLGNICLIEDIDDRKKAEQALADTLHSLGEAQRIGQIGSWELDPESGALAWSAENYRLLDLDPETFTPTYDALLELVHPDDRQRMVARNDLLKTGEIVEPIEYRLIRPDGETLVLQSRGEIVHNDDGTMRLRGTVQDITDQKRIEEELASLNTRLEARVEERTAELRAAQEELVKSERLATLGHLTATVSHELRNPLGAIRTSMYIVEKVADTKDDRFTRSVDRINRSVTRCDNIIDELLDFTRIQNLEPAETLLDRWLGVLLSEQIVPEGIEVRRKFGAPEIRVMADTDRLRRAVINVYENACHALAQAGEAAGKRTCRITVETRVRKNRYEIIVSDTGEGIPQETLPKIFEPLFSTKNFGVGLGLPTVKQIMEQHSGGVEAGNGRRQGARFVLWLPLVPVLQEIEG